MSNTPILIKGARILDEESTDVLVSEGRVREIGSGLSEADAEVIDAYGLVLLPGLVDLHTHLREPGREDAETVESGHGCRSHRRLHGRSRHGEHRSGSRHGRSRRAGLALGAARWTL